MKNLQIEKLKKEIAEREAEIKKLEMEENKKDYIEVPELGIKITPKQQFNGKTYAEILKEVSEDKIVNHKILNQLRDIWMETGKYNFVKDFWVFVPNPNKKEKIKGNVAGFIADSGGAGLGCFRDPSSGGAGLGVFLYEKITSKAHKSKSKEKKK